MRILEVATNIFHEVEVVPVVHADYKFLVKKRYFFDWKLERDYEIFKLRVIGSNDILGLVSFQNVPEEFRFHIRLLSVSIENVGHAKQFVGIAGNLIVFVAKITYRDYGVLACVSLKPKSQITKHYIKKYDMRITGETLSLEMPELLMLIKKYQ